MARRTRAIRKAAKGKVHKRRVHKGKVAKGKVPDRPKQLDEARAWAAIDPYVSWALGTGRNGYFLPGRQVPGKELMPLAVRLEGDSAKAFQAGAFIEGDRDRKRWQASLRVLGRRPAQGVGQEEVVWLAAMAPADLRTKIAKALSSRVLRAAPRRLLFGRPLDTAALVGKAQTPPPAPRAGAHRGRRRSMAQPINPEAVVMGIIDDGIAFANERFLNFGGAGPPTTRVEFWWLQDGAFNALPFGLKLDKAAIDPILAACSTGGVLDEELFYRRVRLLDPNLPGHKSAAWRAAHGTHVMDLACGFDPNPPVQDRPIVCVQLPTRATQDEEPGTLDFFIANAIDYIVQCAQAIALAHGGVPLPVVINLSYGLLADPHDGTSVIETFIEDKIVECAALGIDLRVVIPAGNSYLSRSHADIKFAAAPQTQTLHWRVLPDDRTPSFLEIWLPPTVPGQNRVTLTVRSPTGAAWNINELGPPNFVPFGPAPHYGAAYYVPWLARGYFVIALQPTADPLDLPPGRPMLFAPAGVWGIDITHNIGLAPQDIVHAWVRRDDQIYSFPTRGRQSFFEEAAYARFDHAGRDEESDAATSIVRRESTLNSMATGLSTVVIGGFLGKEGLAAKYTAGGAEWLTDPWPPPGPPPHPRWPDAAAVSDDSFVHAGVLAAGSRSNSVVAMNGSSVAAPQVARVVAERLAGGFPGGRLDIQGLAVIPLATRPGPPMPGRTGAGGLPTVPVVTVRRFDWP